MELHLPTELHVICALNTLKLESSSFVEDDLRQYFSDVLYSLKTTSGDGYIHVPIEHQTNIWLPAWFAMCWLQCCDTWRQDIKNSH